MYSIGARQFGTPVYRAARVEKQRGKSRKSKREGENRIKSMTLHPRVHGARSVLCRSVGGRGGREERGEDRGVGGERGGGVRG